MKKNRLLIIVTVALSALLIAAFATNPPIRGAAFGGNSSGVIGVPSVCDNFQPINLTASAKIITGVAAQKVHICSINLVAGAADNVALIEGTGALCVTGATGMAGGATAATGWNLAANGGIAHGAGVGDTYRTATTGNDVCLLVSAASQLSGVVSYTIY